MTKKRIYLPLVTIILAVSMFVVAPSIVFAQETTPGQEALNTPEMQLSISELMALLELLSTQTHADIPQISSQQAREIATNHIGHGVARETILFSENGVLLYEVDVRSGTVRYMIYINAFNGSVVRMSRFEGDYVPITTLPEVVPQPQPQPTPPANQIQTDARFGLAAATALQRVGGGRVRHVCITRERGTPVYHVRIYHNGYRKDFYLNRDTLETERERSRQHSNASSASSSYQRREMNVTPAVSFNEAANIALTYVGGGTIREISRSYIGGRRNPTATINVSISLNREIWCIHIDIHTGEVLRSTRIP